MTPIEEVSFYAWVAWNDEEEMWGLVVTGIQGTLIVSAAGMTEYALRRMKPLVGAVARQTEKRIKLVKFRFAQVLDEVGG